MPNHISHFEHILKKFESFPLWIKQALFVKMLSTLGHEVNFDSFLKTNTGNVLGLYVPKITSAGISLLKNKSADYDPVFFKVLKAAYDSKTLIDICNDTGITLSECARYVSDAVDQSYITTSSSPLIMYTIFYVAGRLQLEHYLYRIGKINQYHLKQVMYAHKQSEQAFGEGTSVRDIIENLSLINDEDKVFIDMIDEAANTKVSIVDEALESMQETTESMQAATRKLKELEFVESKYKALLEDNGFLRQEIADQVNEIMALKRQLRQVVGNKNYNALQQTLNKKTDLQADNA